MDWITIRQAKASDAACLNAALAQLSADLKDTHRATAEALLRAGFAGTASFAALLAECDREIIGVAMFSPVFSTTRGAPGAYVSDLWVAKQARQQGLGRRLLKEAAATAKRLWGAEFLKLSVYRSNVQARQAYKRLGFDASLEETNMVLKGQDFQILMGDK